jgi:choline-sulfatase
MSDPRLISALDRVFVSLAGAALAGLGVAAADASYAAEGLPSARLFVAELGLIAPLALVVGVLGALVRLFALPPDFPSPGAMFERWRSGSAAERRERSVRALGLAVFGVAALIVITRVALRVLVNAEPPAGSGAALALAAVVAGALVAVLSAGAGRLAAERAEAWSPDPVRAGAAASLLALVSLGLLIALGTTSGAGGVLAVFGVFKRQELDLRAPAMLLALSLGAVALPPFRRRAWGVRLALLALTPCVALQPAATTSFDRRTALSVERHAPLGKRLLAAVRHATDRDRDGASAWFGGGDCAEGNAKIGPAADDVPANGIDEDCSGADALPVAAPPPAAKLTAASSDFVRGHVPKQPNVILITIDAARADLGYMGYKRPVSPRLDELAKKSAVFENAYSLASYTSKSLGPMLIGRYGSETRRGWLHFNRFPREEVFVSERLQRAGIRTVSVQGHWYFFKNYGFERGWDVLDTKATPADQPIEGDKSSNSDVLSDRIIHALEQPELEAKQFFLWSHYIDAHAEYVPHEGFDFGHRGRELYDGELAYVDHHFGRVLDALAKRPFAERTIVIVTSDHGEAFGEHGLYRHGFELWEELIRVPLVIHVPGVAAQRIKIRRGAIDVTPTILDIFAVPPPAPGDKGALRGVSLLPDVLAPPGYVPSPRVIYADMPAGPYNDSREAYIEDDLKLITSGPRALGLFDLKTDPSEKRDLLDDTAKARPMVQKSKAFRKTLDEVFERPSK